MRAHQYKLHTQEIKKNFMKFKQPKKKRIENQIKTPKAINSHWIISWLPGPLKRGRVMKMKIIMYGFFPFLKAHTRKFMTNKWLQRCTSKRPRLIFRGEKSVFIGIWLKNTFQFMSAAFFRKRKYRMCPFICFMCFSTVSNNKTNRKRKEVLKKLLNSKTLLGRWL